MINLFLENQTLDIAIVIIVVVVLAFIVFFSYILPIILKRKNKKEGKPNKDCGCCKK